MSAGGVVCGNEIVLVQAVGSFTPKLAELRAVETFHPSSIHTASWHDHSAFHGGRITPPIGSNGCFMFDHCTNVRFMYNVAGSRADHVLSARLPVGALGTATVQRL